MIEGWIFQQTSEPHELVVVRKTIWRTDVPSVAEGASGQGVVGNWEHIEAELRATFNERDISVELECSDPGIREVLAGPRKFQLGNPVPCIVRAFGSASEDLGFTIRRVTFGEFAREIYKLA